MTDSLSAFFLQKLDDEQRARILSTDALAGELAALSSNSHAAWPTVSVAPRDFVAFLAERLPKDADPVAALGAMRISDLYLACACVLGDEPAIEAFEARFVPDIEAALRRMRLSPAAVDEAIQILRVRLFVADAENRPKIAEYLGLGDLRSWVRAAAIRIGLRVIRTPKGQMDVRDEVLGALPAPAQDAELDHLKKKYGPEFKSAFRDALDSLSIRERHLLRRYYGHGLTVNELGDLHQVGRSTAARWVAAARETLVGRTRDLLMGRLGLAPSEVSSLLRLVQSQVGVSIAQLVQVTREPK